MDDIIIDDTHEAVYEAVDPVEALLVGCKGHAKPNDSVDTMVRMPRTLWSSGPKMHSVCKALGGVYWIDKAVASKLLAHLTLEPLAMPGQWAPRIKAFYEHPSKPDIVGVPRFFGLSFFGPPLQDLRTEGHALSSRPAIGLRDLQPRAVAQTLEAFKQWGGATIVADCGFGKTRLAVALASSLGLSALILCNREVLMLQWATVIKDLTPWTVSWLQGSAHFDKPSVKVGTERFLGPRIKADVCIASIDTLTEGPPRDILKQFGLVVVDEAHHLAAATLVHALPQVPAKYVLCLSATPDRRDGLEHALYWLGGPASFVYKRLPSITGISGAVEVLKIVATGCNKHERIYPNGQMAFAEMLSALATDVRRNTIILDAIVEALKVRHKIIVVTSLVAHAVALREAMEAREPDLAIATMAGPRIESVKAKDPTTRLVFASYAMLEEGYDDPVLDCLVLATPRSRIQQTVGRIERTMDGKLKPMVIDIMDPFSVYPAMWAKRFAFYKSRGFLLV